jgi:protein-L-isoaspartate(D-aspartate) O-methyltransferase
MTDLAAVKPDHTVLEVGTGSGYQAAILARVARKVCTVEIIPRLAEAAAKVLGDLRYDNVSAKIGDGYHGWLECGPFDAIVVTAALGHVPPPLIDQLKVGGRLVMPLGSIEAPQQLTVVERSRQVKRGCAPLPLCASCPSPARSDEKKCKTINLQFSAPVKAWSSLGLPVDGARSHLTYQEPAER